MYDNLLPTMTKFRALGYRGVETQRFVPLRPNYDEFVLAGARMV